MSVYSNRQICNCLRCVHGDVFRIKDTGYKGRTITRAYAKCSKGVGSSFDYIRDYCKYFEEKESDFMKICRQKGIIK